MAKLTLEQKMQIICRCHQKESRAAVAKEFNICQSTVGKILKNKERLEKAFEKNGKRCRVRQPKYHKLEEKMLEWVKKMNGWNLSISASMVKNKANDFAKQMEMGNISNGWLQRFKARNNIVFERAPRLGKDDDVMADLIGKFYLHGANMECETSKIKDFSEVAISNVVRNSENYKHSTSMESETSKVKSTNESDIDNVVDCTEYSSPEDIDANVGTKNTNDEKVTTEYITVEVDVMKEEDLTELPSKEVAFHALNILQDLISVTNADKETHRAFNKMCVHVDTAYKELNTS